MRFASSSIHQLVVRALVVPVLAFAAVGAYGCSSEDGRVGSDQQPVDSWNGLTQNSLSTNGLTQNGLTQNGLTQNGWTQNGWSANGWVVTLANDANARKLFQYIYSCAMPAGATRELKIDGISYGMLEGSLGLAPEWETSACNDTCQRWVSACVLARTNAYGRRVEISLRAPTVGLDADGLARTAALAVSPLESTTFPIREGSYFGNIFASTLDASGNLVNAPAMYACAGPGSNIPALTMRFCSSQGGSCPIDTG